MRKTLIIHIGWHKTATSLIQLYLDKNRKCLKEYDICYPFIDDRPNPGLIKHSYLYLSILNKLQLSHAQQNLKICYFDELFELSIKEIANSGCRFTIISEEGLSRAAHGISKLMGRYKEYFDDIKIVGYIRRQDYFFESFYSQFVKQKPERNKLYLDDFIHRPWVKKRADYATILDYWAEEFGKENILVAPFERRVISPDPLTYFFKLTGLPDSILNKSPLEQEKAHMSPPREVTEFFRYLNVHKEGFFVKVLAEHLMTSGAVITDTRYFGRSDREKILQQYARSNRDVAKKYLNKEDGVLFEEPVKDFSNCLETWKGLTPLDILEYALPVSGKMSVEISKLKWALAELNNKYSRLKREHVELRNENQRIANLKKTVYRFVKKRYRKMVK